MLVAAGGEGLARSSNLHRFSNQSCQEYVGGQLSRSFYLMDLHKLTEASRVSRLIDIEEDIGNP